MIRLSMAILLLLAQTITATEPERLLTQDAVWMIVMNTPDAIQLEGRGGCPNAEVVPEGKYLMYVQLRNRCPTSGSGLINNYTVDVRSGEIWTGIDDKKYIDSERLKRLRALLGRKIADGPLKRIRG